jgi:hypothetical protein
VLKALVTVDNTARAVLPQELLSCLHTAGVPLTLQELEQRYLRRLVQARLVRATEVDGQTRYELTHEFLVTQITTWIAASECDRTKMLEMLTRAYEVYQVTGQLLSPQALEMLAPWQEQLVLPEGQQAFLTQSQRAVRRRRATLWRSVAGAAAALVLLLAGGGLWYWDAYQREHVDYYAQVITRRGLPEGVGRLTADQVRQRNTSLAFRKHGRRGPVHDIRLLNSQGVFPHCPSTLVFSPSRRSTRYPRRLVNSCRKGFSRAVWPLNTMPGVRCSTRSPITPLGGLSTRCIMCTPIWRSIRTRGLRVWCASRGTRCSSSSGQRAGRKQG